MSGGKSGNEDIEKGLEAIVRGILIGAALGVFASWLNILSMGMGRAVALGGIMGALAGLTHKRMKDRRGK